MLAVLGLASRVFYLTILDQHFLRHQGDERAMRTVSSPAFRGMVLDRNGFPLAVSTKVDSIWINPKEAVLTKNQLKTLGNLLEINAADIGELISINQKRHREFVYLKRGVNPEIGQEIKLLKFPGVYEQEEYKRFYPEGEVTSHVVGFTNIDDKGQEGLELAYNDWLQGEGGKKRVIKDRIGRTVSVVEAVKNQKSGHDLVSSIDRRIQYLAYRELMKAVIDGQASSGSAVVLDTQTGEILAMVNQPAFNPNKHGALSAEVYRNRAITDVFEPGSTIKAFSVASALDSGNYQPDSVIDTAPGWMRVGKNVVKDEHNNGMLSVRQILQVSSNVGVTKMVLGLEPNQLWSLLHRVGFGEPTGVGFPGEQSGVLVKHDPWGSFTIATLGFGYGLSVTPLQLARAYSVIANHGEIMPVSLLKLDEPPKRERVMKAAVADQMLSLLEAVVAKGGTGSRASVPGYRVAGKTGTALIAGQGGYQQVHYIGTFIGVAPVSHPRLVIAVIIRDPAGKHHLGGEVAGPAFEKIMEGTLRLLSVPPDSESVPFASTTPAAVANASAAVAASIDAAIKAAKESAKESVALSVPAKHSGMSLEAFAHSTLDVSVTSVALSPSDKKLLDDSVKQAEMALPSLNLASNVNTGLITSTSLS